MSYRADKRVITAHTDGRTDTQTDAGNDNTRRPKLASGKNVILPTEYHFSLQLIFVSLVLQYISNDISWIHFPEH